MGDGQELTTEISELHKFARRYAKSGYYVFPLHTPTPNGGCSCNKSDCTNQGKHPRTMNGLKDATTDREKVDYWWTMWPQANIGIACEPTGWAVIDIDPLHGGDESLYDLEAQHGKLPDTARQITGGGGAHIIFKLPPSGFQSRVAIAPGIDTRGNGGYIVASPSTHNSGGVYWWEEDRRPIDIELADVPEWFLNEMRNSSRERPQIASDGALIPEGQRDSTLTSLAGSMRSRGMTESEILAALEAVNENRVSPPLPQKDLERIAWSIGRYEPSGVHAILDTEHITVDEETGEIKPLLNGRQLLDMAIQSGVEPPHYLIPDLVVRGRIHLVYGEPESGKTILALSWVLEAIQQGIPVMFVDEESGLASVAQLLAAMGADSVDEYLHYFPFVSLDMGDTEALYAYAADLMPGLIVFDSLTDMLSSAGLDENKGIEVTQWFDQVAQRLARSDWQPAVVLIDHVSKDTQNVKYAVASRAKKAKSDVQWFVEKLNDFDATKTAPLDLHRHKNRPGVLPKKVRFTIGGQDGRLICERFDPSQHVIETLPSGAQEMLELLEREVEMQTGEIANRLGKTRESIRLYGERLVAMGRAERVNAGPRSGYRATAKFGDATAKFGDAVLPNLLPNSGPLKGADLAVDGTGHESIEDEEDEIW